MKLNNLTRIFWRNGGRVLLCMSALLSTAACERLFDGEGDCSVQYQVVFTQTKNIVGADAFAARVKSVSLFIFNLDGELVTAKTESGEALSRGNYAMDVDVTEPGTYDLIAWGGLAESDMWELAGGDNPVSKEDLVCRLKCASEGEGMQSQQPLGDLFHGAARVKFPDRVYGDYRLETPVDLTKNNNRLRIILQHYNGKEMNKDDFYFTVQDRNGVMNYDNTLLDCEPITYREHFKESALVTTPVDTRADGEVTSITSVVAEVDIARLMADSNPILTVEVEGKEKPVLKLPLVDLLLNAKGSYSPQEFLDRQDEYSLIFYLDDVYGWYTKGGVWVNSWHVIYQDKNL